MAENDSLFNNCVFVLILYVLVCDSSAALKDENTLTIDVSAESSIGSSQKWNTYSPDDVRCYCNLPVCVSTSYMCKSEKGGCFSEVVDTEFDSPTSFRSQDPYKGRHGCLELLDTKDQKAECQNMPSNKPPHKEQPKSLLLCCFKDLCNHIDSPETQNILNGTRFSPTLNDGPNHTPMGSSHELNMAATPGYNSNEVWFKAAIIAVPICGVVILFLLIFLAVKILRTDSMSASNKLGGPYSHNTDRKASREHFDQVHHQSSITFKKVPLLMHHQQHELLSGACTNHNADEPIKRTTIPLLLQNEMGFDHSYEKKNETNAKINMAHGHDYNLVLTKETVKPSPLPALHKNLNAACSNNVYRNVNLSLTPNPTSVTIPVVDKLYEKRALSAVINWGPQEPSSSPV